MTEHPRSLPYVALVLAVAILVINVPLIAGGKTWSDIRYHTQIAPARIAAAEAVQYGDLPAWWEGSGAEATRTHRRGLFVDECDRKWVDF